jgi:hypothetical protein
VAEKQAVPGPSSRLARIFHTSHETATGRRRGREEADPRNPRACPPPHVGGYDAYEISGLAGPRSEAELGWRAGDLKDRKANLSLSGVIQA